MKKAFKIIIIGLFFLFFIFGIGVFIFLKTVDFNRFRPQIITASQNALRRSVDFAKIDLKLSLKSGIQLSLADITVGEHPDFGKDNFLTAKEINLGVSVKELILKRQIRVLGVECKSPHITIIRLKDGRINVQAFGVAAQDTQQTVDSHRQKPQSESVQPAAMGLPAIFVNRINIDKARLAYIDYSLDPKLSLTFDRIMLKAEDFSLANPFPITLRAAFASNSQNIFAQGKGQVNMNRLSFSLKDVKVTVDLPTLSMDALRRLIPQLEGAPLPEVKSGELSASVELFEAGPQGLIALKGHGILTKGSLRMKELVAPIESIEAKFTMSESVITLNSLLFSLGKGSVELSGNINDYLCEQNYSLKAKASGINLVECIDQSVFSVKVKGLVFGEFELKGQGFDPHTILSKLNGNGSVEIKEGQLTDINVLKMVLDKLSFVPSLGAVLEAGLPERFKETIRRKDTVVTALKADIGISNGSIQIQPLNMAADGFLFQGNGAVGFDQSYAFEGSFIIPQDLSSRMVGAVPEMEFLLDEAKQIRFPLKVSGKGGAVSFMPDVKQIGITAVKHKGRQELEKVLDKVFDRSSKDGSQQPSADSEPTKDVPSGSAEEKKKSGKQQLIEGVIDTIFKQ